MAVKLFGPTTGVLACGAENCFATKGVHIKHHGLKIGELWAALLRRFHVFFNFKKPRYHANNIKKNKDVRFLQKITGTTKLQQRGLASRIWIYQHPQITKSAKMPKCKASLNKQVFWLFVLGAWLLRSLTTRKCLSIPISEAAEWRNNQYSIQCNIPQPFRIRICENDGCVSNVVSMHVVVMSSPLTPSGKQEEKMQQRWTKGSNEKEMCRKGSLSMIAFVFRLLMPAKYRSWAAKAIIFNTSESLGIHHCPWRSGPLKNCAGASC